MTLICAAITFLLAVAIFLLVNRGRGTVPALGASLLALLIPGAAYPALAAIVVRKGCRDRQQGAVKKYAMIVEYGPEAKAYAVTVPALPGWTSQGILLLRKPLPCRGGHIGPGGRLEGRRRAGAGGDLATASHHHRRGSAGLTLDVRGDVIRD